MPLFRSCSRRINVMTCLLFASLPGGAVFATNVTMQTPFGEVDMDSAVR